MKAHELDCPRLRIAARRAAISVSLLVLATAVSAPPAFADGDPASDVLLGQSAFIPWDAGATPSEQARLTTILQAAAHGGYPIRVALIASQSDLGSITVLWRQPQSYARFLDQELALNYKGPVVIVMPDGVGLASATPLSTAARQAAASRSIAPTELTAVAESTVEKLATDSGHPLSASVLASATGSRGSSSSSTGTIAYVVLALGAVLIAVAWTASLRARPLRAARRSPI